MVSVGDKLQVIIQRRGFSKTPLSKLDVRVLGYHRFRFTLMQNCHLKPRLHQATCCLQHVACCRSKSASVSVTFMSTVYMYHEYDLRTGD